MSFNAIEFQFQTKKWLELNLKWNWIKGWKKMIRMARGALHWTCSSTQHPAFPDHLMIYSFIPRTTTFYSLFLCLSLFSLSVLSYPVSLSLLPFPYFMPQPRLIINPVRASSWSSSTRSSSSSTSSSLSSSSAILLFHKDWSSGTARWKDA